MILKCFDGFEIYVSREQSDAIWAAKEAGKTVTITDPNTGRVRARLAPGAIATIREGGEDPYQKKLPKPKDPELTEEQKRKIAEIKAQMAQRWGKAKSR